MTFCAGIPRASAIVLACLAAAAASPRDASAQDVLILEEELEFGPVPQGGTLAIGPMDELVGPTDSRAWAAQLRVSFGAGPPGHNPCEDEVAFFEFHMVEPLTSPDGGALELGFEHDSGRLWNESDASNYVEFRPGSQIAEFPISPISDVLIGIGGVLSVPQDAPMGVYAGQGVLEMTYRRSPGQGQADCQDQLQTVDVDVPITAEVQRELTVEAAAETIDLGALFRGTTVDVPADGSGEVSPAPFVVTGPASLDYRLSVRTTDLEHEVEADEIPLLFTEGLYGLSESPDRAFGSGDVVRSTDHVGGPLHVHCGFRAEVPDDVAEGRYRGEVTLTVEVLLQ